MVITYGPCRLQHVHVIFCSFLRQVTVPKCACQSLMITVPGSSLKISCGQNGIAFVRMVNHLDSLRAQPHWATQVMSRQEGGPETRLVAQVPKGPRQRNSDALQCITTSIPRSLMTPGPTMNMLPFICGFQDNVTSWMSNLTNEQGGCLQTVARQARQANQGRLRQEQLAQTVAMSALRMPSPDRDQVQYRRAQLAHRDTQLEHARSERDTHSSTKKNC